MWNVFFLPLVGETDDSQEDDIEMAEPSQPTRSTRSKMRQPKEPNNDTEVFASPAQVSRR